MKHLYTSVKAVLLGGMMLLGGNASAQINVDYNALPDYDNVPPVKEELGIPGGNAKGANRQSAKSKAARSADEQLPDHWNNSLFKHFPPYFYQAGPSCMCSSFVGYIFTHELNSFRDLEGEKPENQMAVFFSWLQTYQNSSKEDFELYNGCPNAVDYEGRTNSDVIGYYDWQSPHAGWMQGYDKWHRAMFNRATGHYTFPQSLAFEEGRLAAKRWLYNHNGDTDFKSGGLCYVTLASSGMQTEKVADTEANSAAGAVGKYYVRKWGPTVDHAMTLIGWDDRLEFDFDGDGIYGEEEADERGAWIVANSWGAGWNNGGWTYVPYRYAGPVGNVTGNYFWQPYVTYIRKTHTPTRTIKLLMDYSHRNELLLSVGINADTSATKPSYSTSMSAFRNAGNSSEEGGYPEVPMLGKYVDGMHYEPMEFGYDLSDISSGYDPSKPLKYFFTVNITNGDGLGHIYRASIMDYRFDDEGTEIPFDIDTVLIGKNATGSYTTTISVVVPGEAVNAPLNASLKGSTLVWDAPNATSIKLKKYYIYKNNLLIDSLATDRTSYTVDDLEGAYCISAVYGYKSRQIESGKSNMAYQQRTMPDGDNISLGITNGKLIVPNAITDKLNEGTIEFWIKPYELNTVGQRISGSDNDNFFFEITASGQASAGWNTDEKITTGAKSVKVNTWQHIAIVVQNNSMSLYVNGMKRGTTTSSTNSGIPALGDLLVGTDNKPLNAEIDELRIWKKARTQAEIYSSKDNATVSPSAQIDLLAYLPMNTIKLAGEDRIEEFVCANHGYLYGNIAHNTCTDILNGGSFSISPSISTNDSIYTNQSFQLKGVGSVSISKWSWSTPGATKTSHTLQSPFVTYTHPGTYTVSLTTTDNQGVEKTVEKEIEVINGTLPEPNFLMSATRLGTTENVSFVNRTRSANCTYVWSIDGYSDVTMTNLNMAFDQPGIYNVTLTATNSAGSASLTKTLEVYKSRPTSKFNIAPDHIYTGETTYLEDKTSGEPTSWLWTLSNGKRYIQVDGQFSSLVLPAPGYYDVSLQTGNSEGVSVTTKKRALCVSNADAKNGLVFAGNDEMLEIDRPFKSTQTAFTIEWWMNPTAMAGAGTFTFGDFETECNDKGYYVITYKGKKHGTITVPITNQWHHYAVIFTTSKISMVRDGVTIIEVAPSSNAVPSWPDKFVFGRSDSPFRGYIDELRIWDTALTKQQLKAYCNQPIANPNSMTHLCAYYDFNQNGGDVIDRTGHGFDAKRVNFGPDGDAWIVSPGVFTYDPGNDIVITDITSKYMTNYKRPFLSTDEYINSKRKGAKELLTNDEKSTWITDTPHYLADGSKVTIFVDSLYDYDLSASSAYGFGNIYNHRVYQTVSLPQGHYRFSTSFGRAMNPGNSRLVACYGDTLVNNQNTHEALASCLLSNEESIEFDVLEDNTNISLGMIINFGDESRNLGIKSFKLSKISTTTHIADGVNDVYDAQEKGLIGTYTAEQGAIRVVSNDIVDVKIYNATGQCVFNQYVSGNHRIPLPPGIYMVDGQKLSVR